jgi:hypothetical protein
MTAVRLAKWRAAAAACEILYEVRLSANDVFHKILVAKSISIPLKHSTSLYLTDLM